MLVLRLMDAFEFYADQLESPVLGSPVLGSPVLGGPATGLVAVGTPVIAQQFDQDIIGDTGVMLKGFYESGQLWALLIGLVLGYMFKSFTSYG